jgi:uncharacterized protein (DUF1778 family)
MVSTREPLRGRSAGTHLIEELENDRADERERDVRPWSRPLAALQDGRTVAGQEELAMAAPTRIRDRRLEIRTTAEERELIDRAAEASGTDLTSFVLDNLTDAARRTLADRDRFALDDDAADEWERINRRSRKELAGLRRLMARPSPFEE